MHIWLIIGAIAAYAIYRSAHSSTQAAGNMSAGRGGVSNYKLNRDDGGLSAGTTVSYAGSSTDLLTAVAANSPVSVTGPSGTTSVSAASLDPA